MPPKRMFFFKLDVLCLIINKMIWNRGFIALNKVSFLGSGR